MSWQRYSLRHEKKDIQIAGNKQAYEQLKKYVSCRDMLKTNNLANNFDFSQLMVIGPSGSGKRTLVRKVAQETNAVLLPFDCTQLMRPKPGDTEALIGETFERAKRLAVEGLVVLLVLNLESVCAKPGRILNQMNNMLDSVRRHPTLIVVTTSHDPNVVHESVKSASRFHDVIFLGVPSESDRLEMLKLLGGDDLCLSHGRWCEFAKMTPGYVVADLALVINKSRRSLHYEGLLNPSEEQIVSHIKQALASVEPSAVRGEMGLVKSNSSILEIGGLRRIKEVLLQSVQWPLFHTDSFKRLNIKHSSGILLYGPPGCSKTSLARAAAAGSNVTFLAVSAADLYSPFVGDTERIIASLFQRARAAAPTLLFIDEIDALVGNRQGQQKRAQERVLSSFLIEMDGVGVNAESEFLRDPSDVRVIIVAATNRPHVIDTALLRPGRLDKLIHVPPPDFKDRLEILEVITKKMPLDDDVDLFSIAGKTELFSGADLANLCREAALLAMTVNGVNTTKVTQENFHAFTTLTFHFGTRTMSSPTFSIEEIGTGPYEDLCNAVIAGDAEKVAELLSKGVQVNSTNDEDDSALNLAIKFDAGCDIIRMLLSSGAQVTSDYEDGELSLMLAMEKRNVEAVKLLLDHGADVYVMDSEGSTPLHKAAAFGMHDLAILFLSKELFVDIQDGQQCTPLHLAAKNGHESIVKLLLAHGANLHEIDRYGRTALHYSAVGGYYGIVCRLIDYEVDVNLKDNNERTALQDAAWLGHLDVVQMLLNCGADMNSTDREGFTALHHAAMRGHEDVIFVLLDRGANLSIQDKGGRTPLHHVMLRGNYDMMKLLIEFSDDLNTRDSKNETPFSAVLSGMFSTTAFQLEKHPELVELLIKHVVRSKIMKSQKNVGPEEFEGEWKNDKKEGYGSFKTHSGKVLYEGEWVNGKAEGYGVLCHQGDHKRYNICYEGFWKNGKPESKGYNHYKDGSFYKGGWANGVRNGFGQMWYANGTYYEGDFHKDKQHGRGLFVYVDGNRYVGEWFSNYKHGFGAYYYMNSGQIQMGHWIKDSCVNSWMIDMKYRQSALSPTEFSIPEKSQLVKQFKRYIKLQEKRSDTVNVSTQTDE
ncbi:hypothetical protein GE061_017565 [Apolygus lucorum]|uniref:AAA+ ATPase domain-containing protein n=1 Tax=Apolygus lucorum TaxID=248454 RepID=A0A8S9XBJ1_APOLU|nr:hypothetical protein GE061_017565 [Apolygus lucorum]